MTEDLRIIKTKQNIERSFLELLTTTNFEQVTVKQITEHALTGKSTFYYHYADKYDLAQKLIESAFKDYQHLLAQRMNNGIQEQTLISLHHISKRILLLRKIRHPEIDVDQRIKSALTQALEHQFSPIVDHLTARLLAGLIFEGLLAYEDGEFHQDPAVIRQTFTQLNQVLQQFFWTNPS